jgi:hypothetical protein
VEGGREQALEGIGESLRQSTGKSARELELERDLASLEKAFAHLAIEHELVERALEGALHRSRRPDDEPHHFVGFLSFVKSSHIHSPFPACRATPCTSARSPRVAR